MNRGYIVSILLVLMMLGACAPQAAAPAPAPVPAAPATAKPVEPALPPAIKPAAKPAWEAEWEKTVEAAKKEGRVILATTGAGEMRRALQEGLKKGYGIDLETMFLRSPEFITKILAERRAGLYLWDHSLFGPSTVLNDQKPNGLLQPLEPLLMLPDLTDPELVKKTWYGGRLAWVDRDHYLLMALLFPESPLAINTNLVKEGDIKSYQDLLDPKWKGRIIVNDPTLGGFPGNTFMPMIVVGGVAGGADWLRKLVRNEPIMMRDQRLMLDWLAHGKAAIVVAPKPDLLIEFVRVGTPISPVIPKEGGTLAGSYSGIIALNRVPHPNAAKVFINWLLSKEGQTAMSYAMGGQSARLDVPTDFLLPERVRQPGMPYYLKDVEENLLRQAEVDRGIKEIFGPLLK